MGITIHYRGSLAEIERVEDFEDRVIDLALAVGGNVRLWRSADEQDRSRMVRGLIVDLAPGQESTSLLVSPEGWFINLVEIEDAEKGELSEPPWCSIKTQFGPIEGHVALVELLAALKKEFAPNLEVNDEGGYWEHRDLHRLRKKHSFLNSAIDGLAEAIDNDRLSPEAREDPAILAMRVERLARKVHETISRPAEHPPIDFPDGPEGVPLDPQQNEAHWDALFMENRRNQERMQRVTEEQLLQGESTKDALEAALNEVVPDIELDEDEEAADADGSDTFDEAFEDEAAGGPWEESDSEDDSWQADDEDDSFSRPERDPLQKEVTDLYVRLNDASRGDEERSPSFSLLMRSMGEVVGGLAQVVPLAPVYELDENAVGLGLVQLKRALRGAAFVQGALFLLRADKQLSDDEFQTFIKDAEGISKQIVELLRSLREPRD